MSPFSAGGVLLLVVAGLACSTPDEEPSASSSTTDSRPDQEVWGWETVVSRSGRRKAKVSADHFQKSDASSVARLDGGVEVSFYSSDGLRLVSTLTAARARIDVTTYDMTVLGGVVLVADDSTRLETDSLRWTRQTERIAGEGDVTIRRPDGVETGVGFEASSDLKHWSLHHVTTRLGVRAPLPDSDASAPADSLFPAPRTSP